MGKDNENGIGSSKFEEEARRILQKKDISLDSNTSSEESNKTVDNLKNATSKIKPVEKKDEKPKDLGRVEMGKGVLSDNKEIQEIQQKLGYDNLDMNSLPSKGKFYPENAKIFIRAASVAEIRDYSTIDINNPFDVDDKLNNILVSCTRLEFGNRRASYKDLLEEDRLFIILSIRAMTFVDGENKLVLSATCKSCDEQNNLELSALNLQFHDAEDKIENYYDEINRNFNFKTKSGDFVLKPPTIGVMKNVTDYIRKKEEKNEKWDKSFLQVFPYITQEWRGLTDDNIFNANIEFTGWNRKKFTTIYGLCDKIKIGVKSELTKECSKCGAEVAVPLTFPGGIKNLFVISDISGELL